MGIGGITLSTSLVTLFNATVLGVLISKKIKMNYKELFVNLFKMICAGIITFAICYVSAKFLDDIDLPKGTIRYREKGSAGTHNGMRDIIAKVGETPRLRIGIGRPDNMDLKDYVLSNIDAMSKDVFDNAFKQAIDKIAEFIYK